MTERRIITPPILEIALRRNKTRPRRIIRSPTKATCTARVHAWKEDLSRLRDPKGRNGGGDTAEANPAPPPAALFMGEH